MAPRPATLFSSMKTERTRHLRGWSRHCTSLVLAGATLLGLAWGAGAAEAKNASSAGLAPTPPMGWNSWNTFGKNINEQVFRGVADQFVELGLKDLGPFKDSLAMKVGPHATVLLRGTPVK
jgi:hypothetical protein